MIGTEIFVSFFLGIVSSVIAAYLIIWRQSLSFRLSFSSILKLTDKLIGEINKDGFIFEYVLALGRNAGVIGSMISGATVPNAVVSATMIKTRLPNGQ